MKLTQSIKRDTGHYFDRLKSVANGCVRILLNNVNGIVFVTDQRCKETVKMEKLRNLIIDNDFSYAGLTETNKDWRKSSYSHSIWGATEQWFENRRVQISQNTNEAATDQRLYGGTASIAFGSWR